MAKKSQKTRDSGLSMVLSTQERGIIDKAANILGLPSSTWGRPVLLREAAKVIEEANTK